MEIQSSSPTSLTASKGSDSLHNSQRGHNGSHHQRGRGRGRGREHRSPLFDQGENPVFFTHCWFGWAAIDSAATLTVAGWERRRCVRKVAAHPESAAAASGNDWRRRCCFWMVQGWRDVVVLGVKVVWCVYWCFKVVVDGLVLD
ncbi:hypothetical protein Droror1_Dr00022677 [Drosera rotundifolia]